MSNDATVLAYILRMIELNDKGQPEEAVRLRKHFFSSDRGRQSLSGEPPRSSRSRPDLLSDIALIRDRFWKLSPDVLCTHLNRLATSKYPEVAIKATRLLTIAQNHEQFARLDHDNAIHPAFRNAVKQIVVAPAAQASAIKERQFSFLQPMNNDGYDAANAAIKSAIDHLRASYPAIFVLEHEWFEEMYFYQPTWDMDTGAGDTGLGLAILAVIVLVCAACVAMIEHILGISL